MIRSFCFQCISQYGEHTHCLSSDTTGSQMLLPEFLLRSICSHYRAINNFFAFVRMRITCSLTLRHSNSFFRAVIFFCSSARRWQSEELLISRGFGK